MAEPQTPRVAVYIDFDNIVISRYNQMFGKAAFTRDRARTHEVVSGGTDEVSGRLQQAKVDVGAVIDYASSFGSIVVSRAYADWSQRVNAAYQKQLIDRAIDLTQMFTTTLAGKNGADIRLAVDVVEDLFRLPDVTHVVIVAGDSDYIALAQRARRLGRHVIGIGVAGATSRALMAACDEFSDYDDLPGIERWVAPPRVAAAPAAAAQAEAPAETSATDAAPAAPPTKAKAGSRRAKSTDAAAKAEPAASGAASAAPESGPKRKPTTIPEFSHPLEPLDSALDEDLEEAPVDPATTQKAATDLLVRALRLVHTRSNDEEWAFTSEVKNQMIRMDPAFKEKPLGFKSFSDFIASRSDVVEVNEKAAPNTRRLRLKA
ncbi:NYN domain-containing protein [Leifsonia flava]|uniref:NYN domain-containing protein n=1 Tax=Orlajensenia leifsoniae TaxID=2561933 RepID=A0A4Y9R211_9MICO|nr:NYN domain-containing protein [Leifsonia flava]TFV98198.1 NYN domain-containing protein [Leifsonia flava]